MKPRRADETGYTLLELLIGLALVALVSLAVFSGIGLSSRIWRLSEAAARNIGDRSLLSDALLRRWQRLEPAHVRTNDGRSQIIFEGQPFRMRYLTSATIGPGQGGTYAEQAEILKSPDDGTTLALHRARAPILTISSGTWDQSLVRLGGQHYEFRYYGAQGGPAAWHDTWTEGTDLPIVVALLEIRGDSKAALVMAAPRIRASRLFIRNDELASLFAGVEP